MLWRPLSLDAGNQTHSDGATRDATSARALCQTRHDATHFELVERIGKRAAIDLRKPRQNVIISRHDLTPANNGACSQT
jgi:hypothetical protein